MTVVIISTLTFVLSTMPELAEEIDVVLFDNETEASEDSVERWDQVSSNFYLLFFDICYSFPAGARSAPAGPKG